MFERFRRLVFPTDREKEEVNRILCFRPFIVSKGQVDKIGGLPPILPVRIRPRTDN